MCTVATRATVIQTCVSVVASVNSGDSIAATSRQPNTALTTSRGGGGKNSAVNNANAISAKVPGDKSGEASNNAMSVRSKVKKEDAASKKSSSSLSSTSSSAPTQVTLRNDELSKWGMKALSGLKVSVDGKELFSIIVRTH